MTDTRLEGISIQLYSLRVEAAADLEHVIDRLAKAGYDAVEAAGFGRLNSTAFMQLVTDKGMSVSGSHIHLPDPGETQKLLDSQAGLGNTDLIVAFLPPEQFASADAVAETAEQLNAFNLEVRERGCTLSYHNHWFEFTSKIDGEPAYISLFEQLEPTIYAELDTYWAQTGGSDPAKLVAEFSERARLLHIKDGPADDPDSSMVALGNGIMDIPAILAASQAIWHIVELDRCDTDMFEAVEQSITYLRSL
ncbi:MAG: sugar phosphate isomerase/epimerase [Pseudomonadales bacterium]|jgi:sugar phosphate isomerase/epimerase